MEKTSKSKIPASGKNVEIRDELLGKDFFLLFMLATCCNCYMAIYYCFEQWLEGLGVSPNWRGTLLATLFAMVLLFRPITSIFLLRHGKFAAMFISITVSSLVMLAYPFVQGQYVVETVLVMRIIQGIALAVYSTCSVSVLVSCIPKGQSARGFALFSLTLLLPYSVIPAVCEYILPYMDGEAQLFAISSILGIPSLLMLFPLAPRLNKPEIVENNDCNTSRSLWQAVSHSGLAYVYFACFTFSVMTGQAIFFMKGLCAENGASAVWFFPVYTTTIILVRFFGSKYLDYLPRYKVIFICSTLLCFCMLSFARGPILFFVPVSCLYGIGLALLYPMLAAFVYDRSSDLTRSINSNVMMAAFDLSAMLGPMIGGIILSFDFGYSGVFIGSAASIALCGISIAIDKKMVQKAIRSGS